MSRRRRAGLLLGLALALGGLAASDVAQREAALDRRLGPLVAVIVARSPLPDGQKVTLERLAVRRLPARFAPPGALGRPEQLLGLRVRGPLPAGAYLTAADLRDSDASAAGLPTRPGERVAALTATGDVRLLAPGTRVDVLITREGQGEAPGRTDLALQDVEVVAASAAPATDNPDVAGVGPRVAVELRVTLRQAVFLAAAQSFAKEIRLLPRAAGDRRRASDGVTESQGLG